MSISVHVRRKIIDFLLEQNVPFYGDMNVIDFLNLIWDLKKMPSKNLRFKDAETEIWQHIVNNSDWTEEELLKEYLQLIDCTDDIFIKFIQALIHPNLGLDIGSFKERLFSFGRFLEYDDYTLNVTDFIGETPVYSVTNLDEVENIGIQFYTVPWKGKLPSDANFPCVQLMMDNWDDFNYQTLFHVTYYKSKLKKMNLGDIKILQKDHYITELPDKFFQLELLSYCSLGQTINYYETLSKFGADISLGILRALNDLVLNPNSIERFVNEIGFKESLLRYSEAEKAYREGKLYLALNNEEIEKNFEFTFSYQLDTADQPHVIDFDFNKNDYLPYRINILMGKNGTGKTKLLAKLAELISGNIKQENNFTPSRPSFSKIIAISYSIFDEFYKPNRIDQNYGSYKYCGIRNRQGYLDINSLITELNKSKSTLIKLERTHFWKDILSEIIEDEHIFSLDTIITVEDLSKYSSGQNMVFATMTHVIANIRPDSLLLFDEPETHLHPNAIAKVIRALYKLLKIFNSFAILATHSPIIAQEVPTRYIRIIERTDNIPSVRRPGIECFGENLTVITNDIFYTSENGSIHKDYFNELAKKMNYDEILGLFDNKLSFNAKMLIKALMREDHSDEKSNPS